MKKWHKDKIGHAYRYKREALLNYALNRWNLNYASSIGKTSELIRKCAPKQLEEWQEYYFENAVQAKKNGIRITEDYVKELGDKLFYKLTEVVSNELEAITIEECRDYVYNLIINRTFEGYQTEIKTIYGFLNNELGVEIISAPDEWDRTYNVDFFIKISKNKHIGIQIKPVSGKALDHYQWEEMHRVNHAKFSKIYQGKVFFIYSHTVGRSKTILNTEVIEEIRAEISRLTGE
ncbi:MAG: MjaI family restriction endonuclease [Candidatus Cloacimonadaceae bacterium]